MVLAYAGLARIGHTDLVSEIFEPDDMVPAPGQGALAVECRADDDEVAALLATIDHQATRAAVTAERSLLAALEAGCSAPVGAYAVGQAGTDRLHLDGVVLGVRSATGQPRRAGRERRFRDNSDTRTRRSDRGGRGPAWA